MPFLRITTHNQASRKARREQRIAALKANYGATAGQVIAGNLARGGDGRFSRAGAGASGPIKAKVPLANTGVSDADAGALKKFVAGGDLDPAVGKRLAAAGLVEQNADGSYKAGSAGKALLRAIKKNDPGGVRDAINAGKDKVAKRSNAASQRAARAAASQAKRDAANAKRAAREQARAAQQQQRNNLKKQKLTNRIGEIQAKLDEGGISDQQIEALTNRLEEYQAELDTLKEGLLVVKQANGAYRWFAYSSNNIEDADREIVSKEALERDVERADAEGAYGPVDWWHLMQVDYKEPGNWQTGYAGKGVYLGDCDFNMVYDGVLIESGTFRERAVAEAIKEHSSDLKISLAFTHPLSEPDSSGVFHNIRRVSRAFLPKLKASNRFTAIPVVVKEELESMSSIKEKIENLKALVTGNQQAAAIVDDLLAGASDTQKQADEAGLRKKDGETTKAEAAPVAEAKADAPVAEVAAEAEDGADLTFIGDMTPDEFTTLMVSAMQQALAPLMEAMGQTTTAMAKAVDATGTATKEAKDALAAGIMSLDKRVKELEGDAPQPGGFRASTDPATVKDVKVVAPQTANELQDLAAFWVSGPKQ